MLKVVKSSTQKISRSRSLQFCLQTYCVEDEFTKPIVVFKGENAAYEFIKAIFKENQYYKK